MSHAAHFLRRLDRVSDAHVELALSLYRDDALLREVLTAASLPEGAERVAISLSHSLDGPFVVVTRQGRFVTCLGEGMRVSDMPVVARERLDVAASRVTRMREELGRIRALRESGAEGLAGLAFRRMQQQGPRFAREDAETLLRVQPLIERILLDHVLQLHEVLEDATRRIATYQLDDPKRLRTKQQEHLLALGDAVWTIAHTLVFMGSRSVQRLFAEYEETDESQSLASALALLSFEWGTFTHVMRSLWLVARSGKRALAGVKAVPAASTFPIRLYRELALGAIALASNKLRAEALKSMDLRRPDTGSAWLDASANLAVVHAKLLEPIIEDPTRRDATYLWASRHYAASIAAGVRDASEEQCAAVPEEVARIAWFANPVSVFDGEAARMYAMAMLGLPWVVSAAPEQLFLPREWACRLVPPRGVDEVAYWFRFYRKQQDLAPHSVTRRAEPKPGRNEPCPCGSGRKHKRCCGTASV